MADKPNTEELRGDSVIQFEQLEFPVSEYVFEKTLKMQHCLHHTASGKGVRGDYSTFMKPGKIATNTIVGHDKIYQLFSTDHWGYHLGIEKSFFAKMKIPYQRLDRICIGTEIDNWGPLKLIGGKFVTYVNKFGSGNRVDNNGERLIVTVPESEVVHYADKFRGYLFYQKYTDFQIKATKHLCEKYEREHGIPTKYREDMWDVCPDALKGIPGTYTHVSYRHDKSDCHPQPELIAMLKTLS